MSGLTTVLQMACLSHLTVHNALVAKHCSLMQLLLSIAQGASYHVTHLAYLVAG